MMIKNIVLILAVGVTLANSKFQFLLFPSLSLYYEIISYDIEILLIFLLLFFSFPESGNPLNCQNLTGIPEVFYIVLMKRITNITSVPIKKKIEKMWKFRISCFRVGCRKSDVRPF